MGKKHSKLSPEEIDELVKTTHFSAKELQQWYKGFLKDCPTGVIDKKEFCRIYRRFFPFGDPTTFAGFVFNSFDTNENGVVAFKEFISALSVTSRGSTAEKLSWSFKLYDIDHDGYISREEMIAIVDAIYKMVGQMVNFVSDEETPQRRVKSIFEAMDLDGDGRISRDDFLEGAQNDPSIIRSLTIFENII